MPKFTESVTLENFVGTDFTFSAVPVKELEQAGLSAQFTLATINIDCSISTSGFSAEMEDAVQSSVKALKRHPLSDQILLRVVLFGNSEKELHGFIPLNSIDDSQYQGSLGSMGATALNDSLVSSIEGTVNYSKQLKSKKFLNNAIIISITDGLDNASRKSAADVAEGFQECIQEESLESFDSILIAVNWGNYQRQITQFHQHAGFTRPLIGVEQATEDAIARIGNFVATSLSSTSMALGTGGPSQSITF